MTLTKDGGIRERFLDQDGTDMREGQAIIDAQVDRVRTVLAACTSPTTAASTAEKRSGEPSWRPAEPS